MTKLSKRTLGPPRKNFETQSRNNVATSLLSTHYCSCNTYNSQHIAPVNIKITWIILESRTQVKQLMEIVRTIVGTYPLLGPFGTTKGSAIPTTPHRAVTITNGSIEKPMLIQIVASFFLNWKRAIFSHSSRSADFSSYFCGLSLISQFSQPKKSHEIRGKFRKIGYILWLVFIKLLLRNMKCLHQRVFPRFRG